MMRSTGQGHMGARSHVRQGLCFRIACDKQGYLGLQRLCVVHSSRGAGIFGSVSVQGGPELLEVTDWLTDWLGHGLVIEWHAVESGAS